MSYNKLILKTNAAIETENAISFYAQKNNSLAKRVEQEIRSGFQTILKNPENFQYRYSNIRIFWLVKFPYGIYYIVENTEIIILAFWHSKEDTLNKIEKIR